jgi:Uma2 family endonuclease
MLGTAGAWVQGLSYKPTDFCGNALQRGRPRSLAFSGRFAIFALHPHPMGHALELKTRYTVAEYLEHEELSEFRSEYFEGELFAMAGTSDIHNRIAQNVTFGLRQATKGSGCELYMENLKLELLPGAYYVYPDVVLTCDPRDREDRYVKRYPKVLVEVLSPGTESYDRRHKVPRYLALPSLEALLLVSQSAVHAELFVRKGAEWVYSAHTDLSAVLELGGLRLTLGEVYEGVELGGAGAVPGQVG